MGSLKLPGGRRQVFATKFTLQANPAKNTKLAKTKSALIRGCYIFRVYSCQLVAKALCVLCSWFFSVSPQKVCVVRVFSTKSAHT